jgi:nitrite reductase (NADH) large subunit
MKKLIIAGNGMVGLKLCEKLRDRAGSDLLEIVVYGEEPRPAYDRVHLSSYFEGQRSDDLLLAPRSWYEERGIRLRTGEAVTRIDRESRRVLTSTGETDRYDELVLATGSTPFVPPSLAGTAMPGVFVYRTVEDLEAIDAFAGGCRRGAVLGGGLLGLEAAGALRHLGLSTTVIEYMPRLMPRQLDEGGATVLHRKLEALGVEVLIGKDARRILGNGRMSGVAFADGTELEAEMLLISAGIRPRDDLARDCGLEVGERGGVVVDDRMRTSDEAIFAIGEVALHDGVTYGLVGPGYRMAEVAAEQIAGPHAERVTLFQRCDTSTTLKLVGVDVASFGDPFGSEDTVPIVYDDPFEGVYKKIHLSADGTRLLGGFLVGDGSQYGLLHQMVLNGLPCPENPADLILGSRGASAAGAGVADLPSEAQICSCENVSKEQVERAVADQDATDIARIGKLTRAGTGCGGCKPLLTDLVTHQLESMGRTVSRSLCEHFDYTRQELYDIIRVRRIRSFDDLLDEYGSGDGCEVCKPAVASLMASLFAQIAPEQETIQDTNDRFLANIQRGGTYSIVPRVPGGEITPQKLRVIGEVAEKYDLYTKITGGQRIDLFGARVEQLPSIWEELIAAGFESGHAYGKALRTVKSCVGSSWCRYGVQDSVGFAIRVENRYKGIRAPHKIKGAVSGCIRECAEAQSKDFGVIATEKGWNLYVCGNGGTRPQHAQLLATDLDEESCVRLIDRFLMFYIRTADPLTRTAKWLNALEGGIDYLHDVLVRDSLGLGEELEREMEELVQDYECEWKAVVGNPELRRRFAPFVNVDEPDPEISFVTVRDQKQPVPWPT